MNLCFNIQGEFVTETARNWFYEERRPFKKVQEFLLSCMCGTDIPIETLKKYAEDVLKFKKKFIGNTSDDTFCLVDEEKDEIFLTKYYETLKEYGKIPFEICEYGYINPQGKYIPVEWCKHSEWATEFLKNKYGNKEFFAMWGQELIDVKKDKRIVNDYSSDILVNKFNWILIENPHQEKGIVQTGERITKAQKETLYDYYIYFNRTQEANELYN